MTTTTGRAAALASLLLLAACADGMRSGAPGPAPAAPGGRAADAAWSGVPVLGVAGAPEAKGEAGDPYALLRDASEPPSTEQYARIEENPFLRADRNPLSTFSTDVDTASYAVVRRFLNEGRLPPAGAVRIEELVNYFPYDYAPPRGGEPFAVHADAAACPWKPEHRLVRVGLKGRTFEGEERPAANLVFLVDVSGSMNSPDKLPLLKGSLRLLAESLEARDRVAIVVYAGASGLALPSTPGDRKGEILAALDRLEAGGSTNGGAGLRLAYALAGDQFVKGGTNRVLLCTDGDFNVGTTSNDELVRLVEEKREGGVFLSVLGFGTGNYKDDRLEAIADRGNGNYAYVDSLAEGRRVLVEQAGGTLHTIAKDVKIQVEFNPGRVAGYRLIGYENRVMANRDFRDDRKDAGEIGAGHTVTALYEIVPAGGVVPGPEEPGLKYQETRPREEAAGPELLTVRLRWKEPDGESAKEREFPLVDRDAAFADADTEFRFAAAVACFGMVLRGSEHRASADFDTVLELGTGATGPDPGGWRHEFLSLAAKARTLR